MTSGNISIKDIENPAEFLTENILRACKIGKMEKRDVAARLAVRPSHLSEYMSGKRKITVNFAVKYEMFMMGVFYFGKYQDNYAYDLLYRQMVYDLEEERRNLLK